MHVRLLALTTMLVLLLAVPGLAAAEEPMEPQKPDPQTWDDPVFENATAYKGRAHGTATDLAGDTLGVCPPGSDGMPIECASACSDEQPVACEGASQVIVQEAPKIPDEASHGKFAAFSNVRDQLLLNVGPALRKDATSMTAGGEDNASRYNAGLMGTVGNVTLATAVNVMTVPMYANDAGVYFFTTTSDLATTTATGISGFATGTLAAVSQAGMDLYDHGYDQSAETYDRAVAPFIDATLGPDGTPCTVEAFAEETSPVEPDEHPCRPDGLLSAPPFLTRPFSE